MQATRTGNRKRTLGSTLLLLAICLEIDGGDDFVVHEYGQGKVAEQPLVLGQIRLEAVLIVEEELQPLALDDERVERRQDMDRLFSRLGVDVERFGARPMFHFRYSLERNRHQLFAVHSGFDQLPDGRLAFGVEMADRIEAHEPLRSQRPVEQIFADLLLRGRPRPPFPPKVPIHQLVGLQHADPLADRHGPGVERKLQRPLRWFSASPWMLFLHQHVVVYIADGKGALLLDAGEDLAQILLPHRAEPALRRFLVSLHGADEEA